MHGVLVAFIFASAPWHQGVKYTIDAKLDDENHTLNGHEVVVYVNRSPDTLRSVWFHLYANAFRKGSTYFREREQIFGDFEHRHAKEADFGWIEVSNLKVNDIPVIPRIDETEMEIPLPKPLGTGDTAFIELDFLLKIPKNWDRLGHKSHHYDLTQWYPKVAVFDEFGWHNERYHAIGEFYGEFARYNVNLTIPKKYVIGSTGEIVGPKDYIARLDSIAQGIEVDTSVNQLVTVELLADSVHDFAIVADPSFSIIKKKCGRITIYLVFPRKLKGTFVKADSFVCRILRAYERWYGEYPYDELTVAWGTHKNSMEYPKIVIISEDIFNSGLIFPIFESVVAHEIAHQWFYGVIADNEIYEAWLDESFATFSEQRYMDKFYPPDSIRAKLGFLRFLVGRNISYSKLFRIPFYMMVGSPIEDPIIGKKPYESKSYFLSVYYKGAIVLQLLRAYIGETLFDSVMHEYYRRFRFKHVRTSDFVRVVSDVVGKDMGWFFKFWLYTTKYPDFTLREVRWIGDTTIVEIENKSDAESVVDIAFGQDTVWLTPEKHEAKFVGHQKKGRPVIDPQNLVLESNKCNNGNGLKFSFIVPDFTEPSKFNLAFIPFPGIDAFGLGVLGICGFQHQVQGYVMYDRRKRTALWGGSYNTQLVKLISALDLRLNGYGTKDLEGSIRYTKTKWKSILSPASEVWYVKLLFGRCTDSSGLSPYWEPARFLGLGLGFKRNFINPIFSLSVGLKLGGFYTEKGKTAVKAGFDATLELMYPFDLELRNRIVYVNGDVPVQLMPFLEGRPFVGFERFYSYGGLVGYAGRGLKGRTFAMVELDRPLIPFIALYGAVGWIDQELQIDSKAYWEAGIKISPKIKMQRTKFLSLPIKMVFPLWISRPLPGRRSFGFRMVTVIER